MIRISIPWSSMSSKENLCYVIAQGNYYIYSTSDSVEYCCVITVASSDGIDFETNYRATAHNIE